MALLLLILLVLLGGAGIFAFVAKVVLAGVLLAVLAALVLVGLFATSARQT